MSYRFGICMYTLKHIILCTTYRLSTTIHEITVTLGVDCVGSCATVVLCCSYVLQETTINYVQYCGVLCFEKITYHCC